MEEVILMNKKKIKSNPKHEVGRKRNRKSTHYESLKLVKSSEKNPKGRENEPQEVF